MSRKPALYPGWKMTPAQRQMYFSMVDQVCKIVGAASNEREEVRQLIHLKAFGGPKSAKDIDRMHDFDEFKKVCLAYIQPDALNAQLRMIDMPLIRLRYAINEFPKDYTASLLTDKFNGRAMEDLSEKELTDLRNTLTARLGKKARKVENVDVMVPCGGLAVWNESAPKEEEIPMINGVPTPF